MADRARPSKRFGGYLGISKAGKRVRRSVGWTLVDDLVLIAVDVPLVGDERHKNWAKVVTAVDDTKGTGWAFEGEFIAAGGVQDVPVGAVLSDGTNSFTAI